MARNVYLIKKWINSRLLIVTSRLRLDATLEIQKHIQYAEIMFDEKRWEKTPN